MTRRLAMGLIRLYPRAWRERYEDEMLVLVEESPATWSASIDLVFGCAQQWLYAGGASAFEIDDRSGRTARAVAEVLRFLYGVAVFAAFGIVGAATASRLGTWLSSIVPNTDRAGGALLVVSLACLAPATLTEAYLMSVRRMDPHWKRLKTGLVERAFVTLSFLLFPVPSVPVITLSTAGLVIGLNLVGLSLLKCALLVLGESRFDVTESFFLATFGWVGLCVCYRGVARPEGAR